MKQKLTVGGKSTSCADGTPTASSAKDAEMIKITTEKKIAETVTLIEIAPEVNIAAEDGYLRIWCPGREIRVGPLTKDHASCLEDDIGYALPLDEEEYDERGTERKLDKVRG